MKVVIVTIFPPIIGGPSTQATHLCMALRNRGHTPVVVTFTNERSRLDSYKGIRTYRVRFAGSSHRSLLGKLAVYLRFMHDLDRIIRGERPDVVHCNSVGAYSLFVALLCRLRGLPSVVKFAGDLVYEVLARRGMVATSIEEAHRMGRFAAFLRAYEKTTLALFTLVWATADYRKRTLIDLLGVRERKIRVIPNYIRLSDGDAERRHSGDRNVYLITGGRFIASKRFEDCISGLARLDDEGVVLRLYGAGDRHQEAVVRRAIAASGVAERVRLIGALAYEDLMALFRSSDIYVTTSREEGHPLSLIEAMAAGLPVVAPRMGAIPEMVPEGEAGLLFQPGDIDDFVSALKRLVADRGLRRRMGQAGVAHAARFDVNRGIEEYCRMYEELMAHANRPSHGLGGRIHSQVPTERKGRG